MRADYDLFTAIAVTLVFSAVAGATQGGIIARGADPVIATLAFGARLCFPGEQEPEHPARHRRATLLRPHARLAHARAGGTGDRTATARDPVPSRRSRGPGASRIRDAVVARLNERGRRRNGGETVRRDLERATVQRATGAEGARARVPPHHLRAGLSGSRALVAIEAPRAKP